MIRLCCSLSSPGRSGPLVFLTITADGSFLYTSTNDSILCCAHMVLWSMDRRLEFLLMWSSCAERFLSVISVSLTSYSFVQSLRQKLASRKHVVVCRWERWINSTTLLRISWWWWIDWLVGWFGVLSWLFRLSAFDCSVRWIYVNGAVHSGWEKVDVPATI